MMDISSRNSKRLAAALLLLAAVVPAISGCKAKEVLGRVQGRVTFQGKPVTEGAIVFCNAPKGVYITANLNEKGEYLVAMANGYGLPLGDYQVAITPPLENIPFEQQYGPTLIRMFPHIPPKYRYPETSGLVLTVREGENSLDVDMTP